MASEQTERFDAPGPDGGQEGASHPVDLAHLSRYTLGDPALEREVLELFCTQSGLYVEQMRSAVTDKAWNDAAHTLKGSAGAVGAWRVAEAAAHAEELQGEGLAQSRAARLEVIEAALREANAYIVLVLKNR